MKLSQMDLDYELRKLEESKIPEGVKERIKEFLSELKYEKITEVRRRNYCQRLRKVAGWIPDEFLRPGKDDIKKVLEILSSDKYAQWTYITYINMMKRFYKWHMGNNEVYPDFIRWVKRPKTPEQKIKANNLIKPEEVKALVVSAKNARDRAFFYTLYDSGCRLGEILSMKVKDLAFDDYGALMYVTGKTGYRQVRIVGNSIPYLKSWLHDHPESNNPDAFLFCGLSDEIRGRQLTYDDIYSLLRKSARRAGIRKRIYPHLFRHTRATVLASKVTEAPLEAQMGWIHGSRQTRTYVHLSGHEQDKAILKANGIQFNEENHILEDRPEKCPRCGDPNPRNTNYCMHCWLPLTTDAVVDLQEKQDHIESELKRRGDISPDVQAILNNIPETEKTGFLATIIEATLRHRRDKKL